MPMHPVAPESATKPAAPADLEIKDAQLIFNHVWRQLEAEYGREHLRFPKELILLGGAPGAGKGTNTDFIRELRGITAWLSGDRCRSQPPLSTTPCGKPVWPLIATQPG